MCICDLNKGEERHLRDGDYNTIYIVREHWTYYIMAEGDGRVWLPISYCPVCGRDLSEDE